MANGNGKWQLAFWIVTVFFLMATLGLTNAMVMNDRLSRNRDEKITECMNNQYSDIVQRLARIEAKLGE